MSLDSVGNGEYTLNTSSVNFIGSCEKLSVSPYVGFPYIQDKKPYTEEGFAKWFYKKQLTLRNLKYEWTIDILKIILAWILVCRDTRINFPSLSMKLLQ